VFKKFYEEGNEVEYETENPVKVAEIPDLISQVINTDAEVIDVYFEEVEVEGKDIYPTVLLDLF
jgi:predicted transcriptional regulator